MTTRVTDDHRFEIRGNFDLGIGNIVNAALLAARERLWERGEREISDADCFIEVCESFLDGITEPARRDRAKTWVHLDTESGRAVTSTGVRIPDSVRDRLCCDGQIQPVWERDGVPFSVGRTQRIVPERTRRIVLLRDQSCRVPGCNSDRFLEIHHIVHWLDGGPTDMWNLVALCPRHHRLHHQGRVDITGNADEPGGLAFTDERGRTLAACGQPAPPGELERPPNGYDPPLMGRVDWTYLGQSW